VLFAATPNAEAGAGAPSVPALPPGGTGAPAAPAVEVGGAMGMFIKAGQ
jgi:hypothetical protein